MQTKKSALPENIILIDKPKGISSFDVIRHLRKKLGIRKMGHAGTLDPLASGLMIIGINEATKKLSEYIGLPKVYEAQILLGTQTDTGDMEGNILRQSTIENIEKEKIEDVLRGMTGKIVLPVPLYSAIKVSGKRLYKMARNNETPKEIPKKEMEIFWITLKSHFRHENGYVLEVELEVKSGTYVRSVAEEIGRRLDMPATVKELRRASVGDFSVEDAQKI